MAMIENKQTKGEVKKKKLGATKENTTRSLLGYRHLKTSAERDRSVKVL